MRGLAQATARPSAPRVSIAIPRLRINLPAPWRTRAALAAAALLVLAVGYLAWFRDSSLVRVERVSVAGLATREAGRLRAQLTTAALRMSTLDVNVEALRRAVAGNPLVRSLSTRAEFPHGLRIDVTLNLPVAGLSHRGATLALAADGTLLPSERADRLPLVGVAAMPRGRRLSAGPTLSLVQVAAAAPAALRMRLASVTRDRARGFVAQLRQGPTIVFGDAGELVSKWAAAAAVLASPSSAGASYVDVRSPSRPVAGGLSITDKPQPNGQPASGGVGAIAATATDTGGGSSGQPQVQNSVPAIVAGGSAAAGAGPAVTPRASVAASNPQASSGTSGSPRR